MCHNCSAGVPVYSPFELVREKTKTNRKKDNSHYLCSSVSSG